MRKRIIHRILIIQTASIGDVTLATPLIEKLSDFFPKAKIDFLLKKGIESLLNGHPMLNRVIVFDKSNKKFENIYRLIRQIRKEEYDVVINLQRFASTGLITAFSAAKIKLGFRKNPFSIFFTKAVRHRISANPAKSAHEVSRNLSLIDFITDNNHNYPVRLYPSKNNYAKMSQYKTHFYLTISPTSLWFTKQFPAEKWIAFLKRVDKEQYIYFLGSKNDFATVEHIIVSSGHTNSINLCGKLSFLESAVLMRDAKMNFVNDSAPLHFASAMNAPVTAMFCSTVPAFGFGPLSDDAVIIEVDDKINCRPCGLHGYPKCPKDHFKCALDIKIEKLLKRC